MTLLFPTTQEITHIVRNRVVDPSAFIGRQFCPVVPEYVADIQYDVLYPAFGMTQAHQIGTDPKVVQVVPPLETKRFGTGYWKETSRINEKELLYARQAGTYNQRAGRDLVTQRSINLDTRLETRIEWLTWQAVINGLLDIDENGVKYTVDYKIPTEHKIDISAEAGRKWSDVNSDPVNDINEWILMYRGTGGKAKKAYFNATVAKWLAANKKFNELLKRHNVSMTSMAQAPQALKTLIPNLEFEMYDEGYLDENKTFQPFIPDGAFVIIGEYPGEKMMDFVSTISLHNGGLDKPQPGKFALVEDKSSQEKNPYIDITVGIYGLPRMFHPNWIISAKVG